MIILVGSIKGGVGKSTLATNIAVTLAKSNATVCLVDADRQRSSINWADDRQAKAFSPEIPCIAEYSQIKETARRLDEQYDFTIIDCQGRDSIELRSSLVCADVLITPYKPSQMDVDTLKIMSNIVEEILQLNPELKAFSVLNMAPTHADSKEEIQAALEAAHQVGWIAPVQTIVRNRKAFREASNSGLGVVELGNRRATSEIHSLLEKVLS